MGFAFRASRIAYHVLSITLAWHSTDSVVNDVWDRGRLGAEPVAVREPRLLAPEVDVAVLYNVRLQRQQVAGGGAGEVLLVEVDLLADALDWADVLVCWVDLLARPPAYLRGNANEGGGGGRGGGGGGGGRGGGGEKRYV